MEWCQQYAYENRAAMLRSMVECVEEVTGKAPDMSKSINIHHNYCTCERCSFTVRLHVWPNQRTNNYFLMMLLLLSLLLRCRRRRRCRRHCCCCCCWRTMPAEASIHQPIS